MVQTRARIAAKRCLGNLFPVLPHQLVNDIFSYASDDGPRVMGEKTHMRIVIQQHDDVMRERDDLFRDNERLDALLVVAGMSQLRGVSKAFRATVDEIAKHEHLASVGFPPADATTPVVSVKDYVWDNLEWILDRYCEPRRGDPRSLSELGAAADAISAAVAVDGGSWLDRAKFDAWFDGGGDISPLAAGGFPFLDEHKGADPWAHRTAIRNTVRRQPQRFRKRIPCMTPVMPGKSPWSLRRGSSRSSRWRALADRARAIVAYRSATILYGTNYYDSTRPALRRFVSTRATNFAKSLTRTFFRRASSVPWPVDAWHVAIVCPRGEFFHYPVDTAGARCAALRDFALSLVPPESAAEIRALPSERVRRVDLFGRELEDYQFDGVALGDRPERVIEAFCAFSFRPDHDDVEEAKQRKLERRATRRGGYAVRAADFREPDGGSDMDVYGWESHWSEKDSEDPDFDPHPPEGERSFVQYWTPSGGPPFARFTEGHYPPDEQVDFESDNEEDYVDYSSFLDPLPAAPIVLDEVLFDFVAGTVELRFQFSDNCVLESSRKLQLRVRGTIPLLYSRARYRRRGGQSDSSDSE